MAGLDDEEHARKDAARAEEEWGSELEREAEEARQLQKSARHDGLTDVEVAEVIVEGLRLGGNLEHQGAEKLVELLRELVELRKVLDGRLTVWGVWRDGQQLPDDVGLSDPDGDPIDVEIDASGLLDEALRRQAAAVFKRVELSDPAGPELGAVLALVPAGYPLQVTGDWPRGHEATWFGDEPDQLAIAEAPTREAAILAATAELLGLDEGGLRRRCSGSPAAVVKAAINLAEDLMVGAGHGERIVRNEQALIDAVEQLRAVTVPGEPRGTCESCARWSEGELARGGPSIARWCSLVAGYRQPDAWCDDHCSVAMAETDPVPSSDEQLPGVTLTGNLIRSEGDGDV